MQHEQDWLDQIHKHLDGRAEDLHNHPALRQGRRAALSAPAPAPMPLWAQPRFHAAVLLLVALPLSTLFVLNNEETLDERYPQVENLNLAAGTDLTLLQSGDDLALYQDLDFLLWVQEQDEANTHS